MTCYSLWIDLKMWSINWRRHAFKLIPFSMCVCNDMYGICWKIKLSVHTHQTHTAWSIAHEEENNGKSKHLAVCMRLFVSLARWDIDSMKSSNEIDFEVYKRPMEIWLSPLFERRARTAAVFVRSWYDFVISKCYHTAFFTLVRCVYRIWLLCMFYRLVANCGKSAEKACAQHSACNSNMNTNFKYEIFYFHHTIQKRYNKHQ